MDPDLVKMHHARNFHPAIADVARDKRHLGLSIAGKLGRQAQDMNPACACADATKATPAKGRPLERIASGAIQDSLEG